MFWTDDQEKTSEYLIPDKVIDVDFVITCKCLPMEHAYPLYEALRKALSWLDEDEIAGIHPIYGAESGNGWLRPDDSNTELMYLSRRQKMTLRMPKERLADVEELVGKTLEIAGHSLIVGNMTTRLLSDLPTVFSRRIIVENGMDENEFLESMAEQIKSMEIGIRKMLAGRERQISTPDGILTTRSLMLADLEKEESIRLQETGLGLHRKLGCGLFLPQKGIKPVNADG